MNDDVSKSGCLPVILGFVFTCVGAYQLQEAMRLSMWGVPAKAAVERVRTQGGGRHGSSNRRVTFQFEDALGKEVERGRLGPAIKKSREGPGAGRRLSTH